MNIFGEYMMRLLENQNLLLKKYTKKPFFKFIIAGVLNVIFTYLIFFLSWCVISIYIKKNLHDWLILAFFFILSLFIWPLMQEYFDLIITILALLIFKTKIKLKYTNVLFLFFYLTIFLIGSNIYYLNIK